MHARAHQGREVPARRAAHGVRSEAGAGCTNDSWRSPVFTTAHNGVIVRVLNATLLMIGVVTIGLGLYFATTDRLVLTAAVCLGALIPAAALIYAVSRLETLPTGTRSATHQRRTGMAIFVVGIVALLIGGGLYATPDSSTTIMLWMGPGLVLAGFGFTIFTSTKNVQQRVAEYPPRQPSLNDAWAPPRRRMHEHRRDRPPGLARHTLVRRD